MKIRTPAEVEAPVHSPAEQLAAANKRVAELTTERDEARAFGEEAARRHNALLADQRILRCAFCGADYPPDTPPSQHEALTAHVAICQQHPMRAIERERDTLRARLDAVTVALRQCEAALADEWSTRAQEAKRIARTALAAQEDKP